METLKKGFTLIELLVIIVIIGILAITLVPKLREQLAKAKDTKSISLLGAVRTASSVALVEVMANSTTTSTFTFGNITKKLDNRSNDLINNSGDISVGGIRPSGGNLVYGGKVAIYQIGSPSVKMVSSSTAITASNDDFELILQATNVSSGTLDPVTDESTVGKVWSDY